MIVLVPISPEVPSRSQPNYITGLIFIILLSTFFFQFKPYMEKDKAYIEGLISIARTKIAAGESVRITHMPELLERPLLELSPAKGSWDVGRLLMANLLHGSSGHLMLNAIGIFAGARICSVFLPFSLVVFVFLVGGSFGLLGSILLTNEVSPYIPHLGASGGIFALMGSYYVFNFKYRTLYFFWFPAKTGYISLPTSWFFFLDVVLLELLLSTAQLFPNEMDGIDHLAHVFGFASGILLALGIRYFVNWPKELHTRREFRYWKEFLHSVDLKKPEVEIHVYLSLLRINPYNDPLKKRLMSVLFESEGISQKQIEKGFKYLRPTFTRRNQKAVALLCRKYIENNQPLPVSWLQSTPYDVLLRLSRHMLSEANEQHLIKEFIQQYQQSQLALGRKDPQLERLVKDLQDPPSIQKSA